MNPASGHGVVHPPFEPSYGFHRSHSRQNSQTQNQAQTQNYGQGQTKSGGLDHQSHLSRHGYAVVTQPESPFDYTPSHVRAQAHHSRSNSQSRSTSQNNYNISHGQQLQSPRTSHAHTNGNRPSNSSSPLLSPALSSASLNRYAIQYPSGSHSTFSAPPPPSQNQTQAKGNGTSGGGPIRPSVNTQHGSHPYQQQQQQQQQQQRQKDSRHFAAHSRSQSQQLHASHTSQPQKPHHGHQQYRNEQPTYSSSHVGSNLSHQHPDQRTLQQQQQRQHQQQQQQQQQQHHQKSYSQSYHQSQRQPSDNTAYLPIHDSSRPDNRSSLSRCSESRTVDDDDDDEDDGEIKQDSHIERRPSSVSGGSQSGKKQDQQEQQDHSSEMHKCMDCGKVYKHPNCLWKHRWLHSDYWKSATKFLLSKHQQVQLMEAAAILLGMDESRENDKDPIVSMFSKQRGALANSVGSSLSTSSSSGSPPTSTKSLSVSPPPPPQSDRISARKEPEHSIRMTDAQTNDIQMLAALRNEHVSVKVETSRPPSSSSLLPPTSNSPTSTSPTNTKSSVSLSSSSSSTPPTLAPDDDSLPDADEDLAVVSPPSHRNSVVSSATVHMSVNRPGVVEMGLGMDVNQKPLHSKRGLEHSHHSNEDHGYRYSRC
ncbi:hypothetical protein BGX20_008108 [Mortierella sp. AD010]|nr:hypothetical protein BGX20_008108 [Mortierella sp. AD010]